MGSLFAVVASRFPYRSLSNGLHEFYFADTHFEIRETRQLPSDSFGFFLFDGHFSHASFSGIQLMYFTNFRVST